MSVLAVDAGQVSPLLVAVLGGVGAFVGAVLGGFAQLYRDKQERAAVDRRRVEDAERGERAARRAARMEEYRQTLLLLYEADAAFENLQYRSAMAAPWSQQEHPPVTAMQRRWEATERAHLQAWHAVELLARGPLRARAAALDTVGSTKVRDLFRHYLLTAEQVSVLGSLNLRPPDFDEPGNIGALEVSWPPRVLPGVHASVPTDVQLLAERSEAVRAAVRAELDLAD